MNVTIERTEPTTGGEHRTPRERIEPVFTGDDLVEVDAALDASSSTGWGDIFPDAPKLTVWGLQVEMFRQLLAASQDLDSQAKREQAGGDDSHGGYYTAFFNHGLVRIGSGDDDGDLNTSNLERKVGAIRVEDQDGTLVPLPYGGTRVCGAVQYLDRHYLKEFAKDETTGELVPIGNRPRRARFLSTDGAMDDMAAFGHRLEAPHGIIARDLAEAYPDLAGLLGGHEDGLWPDEQWFACILGHGRAHNETVDLYRKIADRHPNVHVYSFDRVFNAAEIAEDMSVAMLARKAA